MRLLRWERTSTGVFLTRGTDAPLRTTGRRRSQRRQQSVSAIRVRRDPRVRKTERRIAGRFFDCPVSSPQPAYGPCLAARAQTPTLGRYPSRPKNSDTQKPSVANNLLDLSAPSATPLHSAARLVSARGVAGRLDIQIIYRFLDFQSFRSHSRPCSGYLRSV